VIISFIDQIIDLSNKAKVKAILKLKMVEEDAIDLLTVRELRDRCGQLGLDTKGLRLKGDFVQALTDHNHNELKARCSAIGLNTEGGTEELRKRLNDYNYDDSAPNTQMSQLSDIDEGDENESERSTTPRRRTRGRSVDLNSRRLSGLSTRSRTRSSSRDKRGSESERRRSRSRSHSIPKTPTPINDILIGNDDPFEGSPRADQFEQRLANIECKQHLTSDKYNEVLKLQMEHQTKIFNELGSLKEFKENTKSKLDKLESGEMLNKQCGEKVETYFLRLKGAVEAELQSNNLKISQKIKEEIESVNDKFSESIESFNADVESKLTLTATKETYEKMKNKLDNDVAEIWNLINDDVIDEMKLLKSELSEMKLLKSELSKFKILSIVLGLLLIAATNSFPFDAASTFDAMITRFRMCWIWFQQVPAWVFPDESLRQKHV